MKTENLAQTETGVYVGLGSNLGDRAGNLLLAVRGMMNAGLRVARLSSIYETAPVDVLDQPFFLNMVAELRGVDDNTLPVPEQLLARLLRVEYALGRRREAGEKRGGARSIDLDLLLYKDEERATEFLELPHARLHLRRFVLVPMVELAPDARHPVLHKTFAELLNNVTDQAEVKLWSP